MSEALHQPVQHYTKVLSITKVFHVSNKAGKARIGQRVDTIRISSFSIANPLISKGSAVLCFPGVIEK